VVNRVHTSGYGQTTVKDCKGLQVTEYNTLMLCVIMAALRSRCGHYIFVLFLSSSSFFLGFFPRLISAVADWMSAILAHMVWP